MPKKFKGENSKVTAAKERKAAVTSSINAKLRAEKEAKEAREWEIGAKSNNKKSDEESKKADRAARKAEAAALLAQEEALATKYSARKDTARAPPVIKSTPITKQLVGDDLIVDDQRLDKLEYAIPQYSASGLDAALELLDVASTPLSSQSGKNLIDRHPERRAKAAWLAFRDSQLDQLKKDNPGLRMSQLNDMLWKMWQKSPLNPFNQTTLAYNATAADEMEIVQRKKQDVLDRMRDK